MRDRATKKRLTALMAITGDGITKKYLAVLIAIIAVAEWLVILSCLRAVDMAERPNSDSPSGLPTVMIGAFVCINVVLACALYVSLKRLLHDAWEPLSWSGIALALSPWTAGLFMFLLPPSLVPWPIFLLVGTGAPYVLVAVWVRWLP